MRVTVVHNTWHIFCMIVLRHMCEISRRVIIGRIAPMFLVWVEGKDVASSNLFSCSAFALLKLCLTQDGALHRLTTYVTTTGRYSWSASVVIEASRSFAHASVVGALTHDGAGTPLSARDVRRIKLIVVDVFWSGKTQCPLRSFVQLSQNLVMPRQLDWVN